MIYPFAPTVNHLSVFAPQEILAEAAVAGLAWVKGVPDLRCGYGAGRVVIGVILPVL
jgi:hypothetical protein